MGAVTSVIWVMPPALVGDAVEFGMFKGGGDDAAIYMSLYYFVQKMAMAAGVGLALPLAGALGFDPTAGAPRLNGLVTVGIWLPLLLALPGAVLPVRHEDVVANLETEVRRMLTYCGLPFEPRCLEFHRTQRSVRTPSSEQVRQPIYTDSLAQWRNYEAFLGPLREVAEPLQ